MCSNFGGFRCSPPLNVAELSVALSKIYPILGNTFTRETCPDHLYNQASTFNSSVNIATSFVASILISCCSNHIRIAPVLVCFEARDELAITTTYM